MVEATCRRGEASDGNRVCILLYRSADDVYRQKANGAIALRATSAVGWAGPALDPAGGLLPQLADESAGDAHTRVRSWADNIRVGHPGPIRFDAGRPKRPMATPICHDRELMRHYGLSDRRSAGNSWARSTIEREIAACWSRARAASRPRQGDGTSVRDAAAAALRMPRELLDLQETAQDAGAEPPGNEDFCAGGNRLFAWLLQVSASIRLRRWSATRRAIIVDYPPRGSFHPPQRRSRAALVN